MESKLFLFKLIFHFILMILIVNSPSFSFTKGSKISKLALMTASSSASGLVCTSNVPMHFPYAFCQKWTLSTDTTDGICWMDRSWWSIACVMASGIVCNSTFANAVAVGAPKYNMSDASANAKNLSTEGDDNPNSWKTNTMDPALTIDNE